MVSVQPIRPETSVRSYRYLPRSTSDERSSYQDFVLLESREVSVLRFFFSLSRRASYRVSWWKKVCTKMECVSWRVDGCVSEGCFCTRRLVDRNTTLLLFRCDASLRTCRIYADVCCAYRCRDTEAVWGRYEQWQDLGSSLSPKCLSYLPFHVFEPAQPVKPSHSLISRGSQVDTGVWRLQRWGIDMWK